MRWYRVLFGAFATWFALSCVAAAQIAPPNPNADCERSEPDWHPQEIAVWKDICRHGEAVLQQSSGRDLHKLAAGDTIKIVLRPQFIKTVLTRVLIGSMSAAGASL